MWRRENELVKHRLIADVLVLIILFSLSVQVFMIGVSKSFGGIFAGTVYASPGVVSRATIVAFGSEGYGYVTTQSSGQYLINMGLKTGSYTVSVIAEGYLIENREKVSVVVGQETSDINFYLHLSGGISGKVTDAVSGLPLQNIVVMARSTDKTHYWSAGTDANGNYRILTNLATGTYNVTVVLAEGHVPRTVSGIAVTAGVETPGVNLVLGQSGIISGRVTATPSGNPLGNATVTIVSRDGQYSGFTQTDATGYFRISSGLGTGTYTVFAVYEMSFGQATGVNVVAGSETSNVNIALAVSPPQPSGIIMGRVTDTISNPITTARVTAQGPAGSGEASTDEKGNYIISKGLGTGTYTVRASATGYSPQNVSNISVTVSQATSNINFQLSPISPAQSGRISGTVQGDENPIPEFQYPIAILFIATSVAIVLVRLFNVKARRVRLS